MRLLDKDDKVSVSNSIKDLFNHFRVANNEKHPIYFEYLDDPNIRITKHTK